MRAQMIHMGGCKGGESSSGYKEGGAFTAAVCNVWNDGTFDGTYRQFYDAICVRVKSGQQPQYNEYGPVTESFRNERPFASGKKPSRDKVPNTLARVECIVEIRDQHLSQIKRTIQESAVPCLLDALDDALSQRPGSASVSCTGTSGGGVSCTGTVTITW